MSTTRDTGFLRNAVQVTNQGIVFVSGSTLLMSISSSGAVTTTGVISGSNALSASFSLNSALLNGTGSVGFATTGAMLEVSSSQQQISASLLQVSASYISLSGSYNTFSGSASTRVTKIENNYATTGSNSFRADQSITGSLVVSSTITAQTLVVQTVTSSIVYSSGSNLFGSALGDRQTFTGSLNVTGSNHNIFGNVGIGTTNSTTKLTIESSTYDDFIKFTRTGVGSMGISATNPRGIQITDAAGSFVGLSVSASGFVGIGATDPIKTLDVRGTLAISNNASSYWYMDRSDDDGRFKILTDGNSEKFSIAATGVAIFSGSVGIGAVTPSVLLNTFLNDDLTTIQIRAESNTSDVVSYTGLGASVLEYYRNIATGINLTIQTKIVSSGDGGNIVFSPNSPSVNLTPVERMRITKNGNVAIGTTGPVSTNLTGSLTIVKSYSGDTPTSTTAQTYYVNQSNLYLFGRNAGLTMVGNANEECIIAFASPSSAYMGGIRYSMESTATGGAMKFQTSGSNERMRITPSGSVGIGTTDPLTTLSVKGSGANGILLDQDANSVNASSRLFFKMSTQTYTILADNSGLNFMSGATPGSSSGAVKMTLTSGGNLGINTTSPTGLGGIVFVVSAASTYPEIVWERTGTGARKWGALIGSDSPFLLRDYTSGNNVFRIDAGATDTALSINSSGYVRVNGPLSGMDGSSAQFQVNGFSRMGQIIMHNLSNTAQAVSLSCSAADTFFVNGTFTANVKSFLIPHPLTNLKATHNLRYVSVESPQADLIYRGKIRLIAGRATVNMDEAATMTEGTFEALCREVQCFTSNETGWDLTKGTVDGNILTIESQNTESTDEISWLIIGERQDEYMMNTDWTDSNGRVIVQPLAPEENNIF